MVKSRPLISQPFVVFGGIMQNRKVFLDNLRPNMCSGSDELSRILDPDSTLVPVF